MHKQLPELCTHTSEIEPPVCRYTLNINLPGDSGDAAYRSVWEDVVAPAARRFQPDIILVSAGTLCDH